MAVEMYRMYMDERLLAQLDWAACYVYLRPCLERPPKQHFEIYMASSPPMLGEHFLVFDAVLPAVEWTQAFSASDTLP